MSSLTQIPLNQKAKIVHLEMNKKTLKRFMEMGLRCGKTVQILGRLPFGGNLILLSEHGKYTLRKREAQKIKVAAAGS